MSDLIQQLKDNEKPFGLMSAEMKRKMRSLDTEHLQIYQVGDWFDLDQPLDRIQDLLQYTFSLRPDKVEQPEIVECEIRCNDSVGRFYFDGLNMCPLSQVFNDPDFIGFKFKDGTVMGSSVKYSVPGITSRGYFALYGDIKTGQALEHHATHVLVRSKNND